MARLITPLFFLVLGIIYLIMTFNLTKARVGDENGPLYFPILIGGLLVLFSLIYFIQEWRQRSEKFEELKGLFTGRAPFLIVSTLVLIFIYTFLFERIGFLISTMLFLTGLLFVINGKQAWFKNILIAVIFSIISWYSFSELLNVSLP
ncbi:tripartite tricarboxylate transporter TctB family protein [Oceanobacillus jeddahense]|uniref:tripartite tricarboxylate transporter TctB family protein n=1 Tax=Oceanobacillus jeddahense TaxID=1462527 RepID=UPI0005962FA1|nr:tripartite tricarboxylate transporter TctB family protein [Oceanobacillus jeddahense]